jgi:ABC-2 type transport system ATP-binding protein
MEGRIMNTAAIKIAGLSKSFYPKKVLDEINLDIEEGCVTGLLGKNGAGKTTLIKCLLGLLKQDMGECFINGEGSWNFSPETREAIGYVPQIMTGFTWLKASMYLDYMGSFYNSWNAERAAELLEKWDVNPAVKIRDMSIGERQKLMIIQAIAHDPDIYILDEPVASLDPLARRLFLKELIEINLKDGKTILFSSHITSDIERIAADVAILRDSKILYKGAIADLKDRIKRIRVSSSGELPEKLPFENVIYTRRNGSSAVITVDYHDQGEIELKCAKHGFDMSVEDLNLEEIFLELNR